MKEILKKIVALILQIESRLVIWKYQPKIIAITGSIGKTSTKDAVFAVLSQVSHVRKSEKSYNSEIGLPLTILGVPNGWSNPLLWLKNIWQGLWLVFWPHQYPKWLVLEVGVGKQGDMRRTAAWLRTDAVIITAIGETPAHIEFFDSKKQLIEEKSQLIQTLKKDGLLILNADDQDVLAMKPGSRHHTKTYGFGEVADVRASGDNISYDGEGVPIGVIFRVDVAGKSLPAVIEGVFGRNHVYASLGALALSSGLGLNILSAIEALRRYDVSPGRMRLLPGIKGSLIIDDTYNSSPFACHSALETLRGITGANRKIAILGDMLELGRHTEEAHKEIGQAARASLAGAKDALIVVGARAQAIKEGAQEAGLSQDKIFQFTNSREAGDFIKDFVEAGDLVLVKGSQGMRMERVVEHVLLDPKSKKKLLVRQDSEWQKKV